MPRKESYGLAGDPQGAEPAEPPFRVGPEGQSAGQRDPIEPHVDAVSRPPALEAIHADAFPMHWAAPGARRSSGPIRHPSGAVLSLAWSRPSR